MKLCFLICVFLFCFSSCYLPLTKNKDELIHLEQVATAKFDFFYDKEDVNVELLKIMSKETNYGFGLANPNEATHGGKIVYPGVVFRQLIYIGKAENFEIIHYVNNVSNRDSYKLLILEKEGERIQNINLLYLNKKILEDKITNFIEEKNRIVERHLPYYEILKEF